MQHRAVLSLDILMTACKAVVPAYCGPIPGLVSKRVRSHLDWDTGMGNSSMRNRRVLDEAICWLRPASFSVDRWSVARPVRGV